MEESSSISISCEEIQSPLWLKEYESFVLKVLLYLKVESYEIAIIFSNNNFIHKLNKEFRGKNEPTDILSFPYEENQEEPRGDLIISLDMLKENSLYFQVQEQEELKRLTIHGILHLMGWDHATNEVDEPMLKRQEEILSIFEGEILF